MNIILSNIGGFQLEFVSISRVIKTYRKRKAQNNVLAILPAVLVIFLPTTKLLSQNVCFSKILWGFHRPHNQVKYTMRKNLPKTLDQLIFW